MTAPHESGSNGQVVVHVFGRTDVGRTREHNEDAFVVADLTRGNATLQPEVRTHIVGDRGSLFMVADGMGGAAAGEIASAMAIEVVLGELSGAFTAADAPDKETYAATLKRATATANSRIHQYALDHPEFRGMGTTATIACVLADTLFLAQVGDSRAYLVRDGTAMQITKDQSLMQKLIEAGEITEEEAEQSERRNIILQALGPEANVKVDLTHQQVRTGDTLILCSDGLSGQVRIDEIARVATDEPDLMQVCKRLIDRANENGGPDNITVIAVRFDGAGLVHAVTGDAVGHRVFPLPTDSGQSPAISRAAGNVTAPTNAVRIDEARRPTLKIAPVDDPLAALRTPPAVSAKRRTRGSVIALALMLVFLIGAMWFVYRMVSEYVPKGGDAGCDAYMTLELRVLSGSRAGNDVRFDASEVTVGRHATSDLRFDPQKDLDVSTRHAEFRKNASGWVVADLESTNGTLVNGERVTGECRVYDGDIITFGANGPRVEVHGVGASRKSPPTGSAASPGAKRLDTGVRVAIEVKKQTKTMRNTFAAVIGLLVVAGASAFMWTQKQSAAREAEYAALIARGDSTTAALQRALASIPATDTTLMNRLKQEIAEKEGEIQRAKAMIAGGTMTAGSVAAISQRMGPSSAALQMDFSKVSTLNDAAVAMVVADLDGVPTAGTAFSISAGGMMVTNKHVVRTEAGQPARRIVVLFANKQGWIPAKVVRVSDTDDLALIQVDGTTPRPVVSGVSREGGLANVGAPVASIGFPLANDTPMGGSSLTDLLARTTITPGTVSKRLDDVIQMDSFAGHGSSGSPLFDASGTVVGVIYGGAKESNGRIVYAVPAQRLAAFLGPDGGSVMR